MSINEGNEEEPKQVSEKSSIFYLSVAVVIIILLVILILSLAKYINPYKPEQVTYNYFTFVKKDTHWMTDWQGDRTYEVGFRFNPLEAETVPISGSLNKSFNEKGVLYVSFDPLADPGTFKYTTLGAGELNLVLQRALSKNIKMACTRQDDNACIDRPIIDCSNSSASVIYLEPKGPARITLNNSCITLQGEEFELIKSIDRLLYQWLKIMN